MVTDWGPDGKRLEPLILNFCGRKAGVHICELSHNVPPFKVRDAAILLESNLRLALPNTIFLCVVDPGVGSDRRPLAVQAGNNSFFVGPDNGVFDLILRGVDALFGLVRAVAIHRESPHVVDSDSGAIKAVDGDSLFAPAAAAIIKNGGIPEGLGAEIRLDNFHEVLEWDVSTGAIVEVDYKLSGRVFGKIERIEEPYGSFATNIPASSLIEANYVLTGQKKDFSLLLPFSGHFAAVGKGNPVLVEHGNGFVNIAINRGSAVEKLPYLRVGNRVQLEPAESCPCSQLS